MQFVGGGLGLDMFPKWKYGAARAKCRACDVATQPRVPTDVLRAEGRILSRENRTIPGSAQLRAAMRNRSIWIATIIRVVAAQVFADGGVINHVGMDGKSRRKAAFFCRFKLGATA